MKVPPEVAINTIISPCVCHFKDTGHSDDSHPHFYIIIPVNSATDLVVCIITSKRKKRIDYYERIKKQKAVNSLVKINRETFSFLSEECVVECNCAELVPKDQLIKKIHPAHNFDIKSPSIPAFLLEEVKKAIKNSPLVKDYIKKLL